MTSDTAIALVSSVLVVAAALTFVTTAWAGVIGAPHVATPKKMIREALKLASLKKSERFYDLGAGNGHVLVIAAKEFGARATGFELSLHHYLFAKLNIWLKRAHANVLWRNLYHENLRDADVVFLWLTPKAYRKLQKKFETELRPGTRVVMFSSALGFWNPTKTATFGPRWRLFLYEVK